MNRRLLAVALFALAMWLAPLRFACSDAPVIGLVYQISNGGATEPGSVHPQIRAGGWLRYVENNVKRDVAWCEASGVTPIILVHLPFGHWRGQMHLDNLDWAVASGCEWMLKDFAQAWRPIAAKHHCVGYIGSIDVHPDLTSQPPAKLAATIRRNVRPFQQAGFQQLCIDHTGDAVVHPVYWPNSGGKIMVDRSLDAFQLLIVDRMFPTRSAVEPAPRRFAEHADLATRDCWQWEGNWTNNFGPFLNKQGEPDEARRRQVAELGWADPSHLKGRVFRMIKGDVSVAETLAGAQRIAREGCVPAIQGWKFLAPDSGIRAGEIFTR